MQNVRPCSHPGCDSTEHTIKTCPLAQADLIKTHCPNAGDASDQYQRHVAPKCAACEQPGHTVGKCEVVLPTHKRQKANEIAALTAFHVPVPTNDTDRSVAADQLYRRLCEKAQRDVQQFEAHQRDRQQRWCDGLLAMDADRGQGKVYIPRRGGFRGSWRQSQGASATGYVAQHRAIRKRMKRRERRRKKKQRGVAASQKDRERAAVPPPAKEDFQAIAATMYPIDTTLHSGPIHADAAACRKLLNGGGGRPPDYESQALRPVHQHLREQLLRNRAPKGCNALPGMRSDSTGYGPTNMHSVAVRNPQVHTVRRVYGSNVANPALGIQVDAGRGARLPWSSTRTAYRGGHFARLETTGVPIAMNPHAPVTTRSLLPHNYARLAAKHHEASDHEERVWRNRCYQETAGDWAVSEVVDHPEIIDTDVRSRIVF